MWLIREALSEHTRYTQLADGRWRAEYNGFVRMTAEGQTPTESEVQLNRAMDTLPASLIRGGKGRQKTDPDVVISSLMLSDAISVVMDTAKETTKFKTKTRQWSGGSSESPEEPEEHVAAPVVPKTQKRR
jgi:hypothetical protein